MKRKLINSLLFLILLSLGLITACSMEVSKIEDALPIPTEGIVTATLYPTFTPRASVTPLPATAAPTVEPVSGKATAQINVRQRPSTTSEAIGLLNISSEVQVIGRNEGTTWYRVIFTAANGEKKEGIP